VRGVFWFRNDLRLRDNRGLAALAARADELVPVFVLDPRLVAASRASAPRVSFLLDCLARLSDQLARRGCPLVVRRGDPAVELPKLLAETRAEALAWNRDVTPVARARDARVRAAAEAAGVRVLDCKDRVIFESDEVRSAQGRPYAVYTPYRNAWRARWEREPELPERAPRLPKGVAGIRSEALPSAAELGHPGAPAELPAGGEAAAWRRLERFLDQGLRDYARRRDLPAVDGTSRLSPYLRFGAISARACVAAALERARDDRACAAGARKWVDELVWREFYAAILAEHPRVLRGAYREEFDRVRWEDDEAGFAAWCAGRTGFPIIDAGMRQLAATGWMHNRARMIAASFLTKDLLVDWRLGEAHFRRLLVDFDPASNNGGWQWAASTGTDAQPWFRIFNPTLQGERFDPEGAYVRRFVPELRDVPAKLVHRPWEAPMLAPGYPAPIVDHAERRALALARYEDARRTARA
jgi:deoxyribodipyrimidine photo-lyase